MTPASGTLWNRNFLLWWLGRAQSAFGTALAGIATSFLVLHQTGSAGAMGVNLALALLPELLSPLMGALVDRWPLKPPLVAGNVLRGLLQLGIGLLALRGPVPLEAIYAASFLTGLIGAFYGPATQGMTARLVPAEHLERATGLMQGTDQTMTTLGYVGGGVLVAVLGRAHAIVLDGASFLVFAALLLFVQFPARAPRPAGEGFWQTFREGLSYTRRSAVLMGLPLLGLVMNAAFAPLDMLMPKRMLTLGAGEQGYGLFFGLLLGGVAAGSFLIAALGKRVKPAAASVWGLALMGLSTLALVFTTTPLQMYVLAVVMGLTNAFGNFGIGVIFQRRVHPDYFGRVGSLVSTVGMAGTPLTLLALAPLADRVPIGTIFGVSGALTLLGAVAWVALLRRDPETEGQPAAGAGQVKGAV